MKTVLFELFFAFAFFVLGAAFVYTGMIPLRESYAPKNRKECLERNYMPVLCLDVFKE